MKRLSEHSGSLFFIVIPCDNARHKIKPPPDRFILTLNLLLCIIDNYFAG